eukprot:m.239577 g.239577  ORF g.239577 m.239577 type:complete len:545 (+) comp18979_c0_seq4:46-1680(+)
MKMLTACAVLLAAAVAHGKKPNAIFLLADDWGWGDTGAYASMVNGGDKPPLTPNLDKMATEGTMFTRFHTLASVCSPSRASWLTGSWPLSVRSPYIFSCSPEANAKKGQGNFVNLTTPMITRTLNNAGYATAHYGKWHLGCTPNSPSPNAYGIDDSSTYVSNPAVAPQLGNFSDLWFPSNSSRLIVDHAIRFIKNATAEGKPFYLNLWFHISHAPLAPTPQQLEQFPTATYCAWSGMTRRTEYYHHCPIQVFRASQHDADQQIGRLFDFLKLKDLDRDTITLFSGDNGPEDPHVYFNSVGSAGIYRGRKRSLYEGGISTPLIVRWPGQVPAGRVSAADIASIDWFPTMASLSSTALDPKTQQWIRGRDASDLLLGKTNKPAPRTIPLVWDYRFKMPGKCYHQSPRLAIMDPEFDLKLLMNPDRSRVELFNVTADSFEQDNLAASRPADVDRLAKTLLDWEASMPQSPPDSIVLNEGCTATNPHRIDPFVRPEGMSDYDRGSGPWGGGGMGWVCSGCGRSCFCSWFRKCLLRAERCVKVRLQCWH